MAWSQRQRHDELVFHQIQQIEMPAANQDVFFEFFIQAGGGGFVGREAEGAFHGDRFLHRLHAALALHRQGDLGVQIQPDCRRLSRRGVHAGLRPPLHWRLPGRQRAFPAQPGEILQNRRFLQGCAFLRKHGHMQAARVVGLWG